MNINSKLLRSVVVAALACVLLPAVLPAADGGDARLIVKRAANYGNNLDLAVSIDGQRVKRVIFGHSYDAPLSPGRHTVMVNVPSKLHDSAPATIEINVEPGRTYQFTAGFSGRDLYLRPLG